MAAAAPAWGVLEEHATGILTVGAGGHMRERLDTGRTDNPDFSLVSRCLGGDESAWEDLVRVHSRRVYGLCFRFTNSGSEAQDLTQEVFLRVFRTLKTFRSTEGSFATWLARVTRNLLIDQLSPNTSGARDRFHRRAAPPHRRGGAGRVRQAR